MRPACQVSDDPLLIVNLTVWESVEALEAFAYREASHLAVLRRRREWFERPTEASDRPVVGRGRAHSDARRGARPAGDAARARPLTAGIHVSRALPRAIGNAPLIRRRELPGV